MLAVRDLPRGTLVAWPVTRKGVKGFVFGKVRRREIVPRGAPGLGRIEYNVEPVNVKDGEVCPVGFAARVIKAKNITLGIEDTTSFNTFDWTY